MITTLNFYLYLIIQPMKKNNIFLSIYLKPDQFCERKLMFSILYNDKIFTAIYKAQLKYKKVEKLPT